MASIYQTKTTVAEWYGQSVTIPQVNSPKFAPFASSCMGIAIALLDKKTNKKINVGLSFDIDTAYASPDENLIVISDAFMHGDFSAIGASSKLNAPKTVGAILGVIVHEIGHFAYSPKTLAPYVDHVNRQTQKIFNFDLARTLANTLEDIHIEYQIARLAPTLEWTLAEINKLMLTDEKFAQTTREMKSVTRPDNLRLILNFLLFAKVTPETRRVSPFAHKLFAMARTVTRMTDLQDRIELCLALYELLAPEKTTPKNAPILPKQSQQTPEPEDTEDDQEDTEPEDANAPTEDENTEPNAESENTDDQEDTEESDDQEDDYTGSENDTDAATDDFENESEPEDAEDDNGASGVDFEDDQEDDQEDDTDESEDTDQEDDTEDNLSSGASDDTDVESEDDSTEDESDTEDDSTNATEPEDESEDESEDDQTGSGASTLGNESDAIPQIDTFQTRDTMPIPSHAPIQTDLGYKPSLDGHIVIEKTIAPDATGIEMDKRYTKLAEMARQRTNANVGYGQQKSKGRDLRQIYRIVTDQKVFSTRVQQETIKPMDVILVLDCSGSMDYRSSTGTSPDTKLVNASGAILGAASGLLSGKCTVAVYGHSADPYRNNKQLLIYNLLHYGESVNVLARRLKTLINSTLPFATENYLFYNRDGYALHEISKKFQSRDKKRVMIVISDGAPNGYGSDYENFGAISHTKNMVSAIRASGISVYSISIDQSAYSANNYIYEREYNTCATDANAIDELIRQLYK